MADRSAYILDPRGRRLLGLPPLGFEGEPDEANPEVGPLGEPIAQAAMATRSFSRGTQPTPQAVNETNPTDTGASGGQVDRSVHGTPAAGSVAPYGYRRSGIRGALGYLGEAIPKIPGAIGDVMGAFSRGQQALTGAIVGENTPITEPPPPQPPATSIGQASARAAERGNAVPTRTAPSGEPKAPPSSIEHARRARETDSQPTGRHTYTNEDLARVHAQGPSRGGVVFGSEESLSPEDRLAGAAQKMALGELAGTKPGEITPGQRRALAFEREKSGVRFEEMDKLIDQDAAQQIGEIQGLPADPMAKRRAIANVRAEALQKKLENRRLGMAGWPRGNEMGLSGEPLYQPTTTQGQ